MLDDVTAGAYHLAPFDSGDIAAARRVADRYRDLVIGAAGASVVVLAERHRTVDILTLDLRHFRAIRNSKGRPFRLLPADG